MGCINYNNKEYKSIEAVYGTDLASSIIREYSSKIKNLEDDFYYPSHAEIGKFYFKGRENAYKMTKKGLETNPYLSELALRRLLKGVVSKYRGDLMVTRGWLGKEGLLNYQQVRRTIFDPNLKIMRDLARDFPNIFSLREENTNAHTVYVDITPLTQRDLQEHIDQEVTETFERTKFTEEDLEKDKAKAIATVLANKFAKAFDMNYKIISKNEASKLLMNTETPYDNEAAFFFNNSIYFIEGNLNINNVLHEYAHPLIRGIEQQNKRLFESLYKELESDLSGLGIIEEIKSKYPKLKHDSQRFKREALVTSLEYASKEIVDDLTSTDSKFYDFIKKIIYAIRQLLRKLVGRNVNLKKLDVNTTLYDLAKMLASENFVVDNLDFKYEDFAEFKKSLSQELAAEISEEKVNAVKALEGILNDSVSEIEAQLSVYKHTKGKLKEELDPEILRKIKNIIGPFQTKNIDAVQNELIEHKERALAFVNSLFTKDEFASNINQAVQLIEKEVTKNDYTQRDLSKLMYYNDFLKRESQFLKSIIDKLTDTEGANLATDSALIEKINGSIGRFDRISRKADNLIFEFVVDFYSQNTKFMHNTIKKGSIKRLHEILKNDGYTKDQRNDIISKVITEDKQGVKDVDMLNLTKGSKNKKELNRVIKEYNTKKLDKTTIRNYLKGNKDDMSYLGSLMVPYMNMNDPIAGGLARFIYTKLSETESKSYLQASKIANNLLPLLKSVGYNPNKTQDLAKLVLFEDTIPSLDKEGDFTPFTVRTILNKFKNWRSDLGKLQYEWDQARESGDPEQLKKATQAVWDFQEKYMHRKYKREVYDIRKIWVQENKILNPFTNKVVTISALESTKAFDERQAALTKMNLYKNEHMSEVEDLDVHLESGLSDYKIAEKEYSDLYNFYTEEGTLKDDIELAKVLVRRKYRELSKKFRTYEYSPTKVQAEFDQYIRNNTEEVSGAEFDKLIKKFQKANFRIGYTDKFYEDRSDIWTELAELSEKYADEDSQILTDLYNKRSLLLERANDPETRLRDGNRLTQEQHNRLLKIENQIVQLRKKINAKSNLTEEEAQTLAFYELKIRQKEEYDFDDYARLFNKVKEGHWSKEDKNRQRKLFNDLSEIEHKLPTQAYIDMFNVKLKDVELPLGMSYQDFYPNIETADDWVHDNEKMKLALKDKDFKEWFLKNHFKKTYKKHGVLHTEWVRTAVWSETIPIKDEHYKKTILKNPNDPSKSVEIEGVPIGKFTYTTIKEKYHTIPFGELESDKYVGVVIDNKGNYLPREYKGGWDVNPESAFDKTYINEEYEELERKNNAQFKLIQELTKVFLEIQKEKPYRSRLYLDLPRMRIRDMMEIIQSGKAEEKIKGNLEKGRGRLLTLKSLVKSMTSGKDAADAETPGFNYDIDQTIAMEDFQQKTSVITDLQGNTINRIPIRGLYKLDVKDSSSDVLRVIYEYLHSINKQDTLIETEPFARSIQLSINDPKNLIKDIDKVNKYNSEISVNKAGKEKGSYRSNAVEYFIEKTWYGKGNHNFQQTHPTVTKIANLMMGHASRAFIALDMTSAMKNRWGMMFQSLIESTAGKWVSPQSLAKGRIDSFNTIRRLTTKGIYSVGPKDLEIQVMEIFDPASGKTSKDFGKSSSRTRLKDFVDMTWIYDFRRTMDFEAALQVFYGMMNHLKIEQKLPNGQVKLIPYSKAWQLNEDKQVVLKEGIDPDWNNQKITYNVSTEDTWESIAKKHNIPVEELKERNKNFTKISAGDEIVLGNSEKFTDFKLKIQGVGKKLFGQVNEIDDAQANKYLAYRLFTFYKRYAVPMFLNRFQTDYKSKENRFGKVYDWNEGTLTRGYWIEGIYALKKILLESEKHLPIMTSEEKAALRKMLAEGIFILALMLVAMYIFGYDKDDEDRFNKMRKREKDRGVIGWLENHLLYQVLAVKMENQAFLPVPGLGLADYLEFSGETTIATGPTISTYIHIINDLFNMVTQDTGAIYSQDVGPYSWQKEGKYKIWNHIGSMFGVKGKNRSAITAIKKYEQYQNTKLN